MNKSTHPFLQLLVMMAIALVMLLVSGLLSMALAVAGVDVTLASGLLWLQGLTQVLCFILPVLLMGMIYYKGRQRDFFRLDFSGPKWLLGLAGVVIMLLLVPLNELLAEWNDSWQLGRLGEWMRSLQDQTEGITEQLLGNPTVGGLLASLLVVALIPAVSEELFFRGGVQNLLERWFGNAHAAIWVTAVVFSLGHGEVFSFVPRFVMGATLGYLYVYGRSLVPNMLAHFVNNAVVVVLYWLVARGVLDIDPEAPIGFDTLLTVCCTLAAAGVFAVSFVKRQKISR